MKRKYPFHTKLLFSVILTILFLLILEGIATIVVMTGFNPTIIMQNKEYKSVNERDFDVKFVNKPDYEYRIDNRFRSGRVRINSLNLRCERELPARKLDGELRILCLGDSCTFGIGVDQDQTYPAQLENLLRKTQGKSSYRVYNGGCSAYTSFNVLRFLETRGPKIKPDLVIIAVGYNDNSLKGMADKDTDYRKGPLPGLRSILFKSNLYWVLLNLFGMARGDTETVRVHRVSPEDYAANLYECIKLCRELNAECILCPISVPPEYMEIAKEVGKTEGIPVVDTEASLWRAYSVLSAGNNDYHGVPKGPVFDIDTNEFAQFKDQLDEHSILIRSDTLVMDDRCHPNPVGYRSIAEDILQLIP